MHQEPIHRKPMAVIEIQKGPLISLLETVEELSLGIGVLLRGPFPVAIS
jgi:hypothetical protein